MGLLNKLTVLAVAFFPLLAVGDGFISGGNGGSITTPPGGISITNGSFVGGSTTPSRGTINISGGTYSAPSGGWGLVLNDTDVTFSGGSFSSVCLQYETNGTVASTIASGAQIETGDGVWLGYYGSDSSLIVEPNATLLADNTFVGYTSPASSNRVSVSGTGAQLLNRSGLYLGGHYEGTRWVNGGIGNSLTVEDDGWVLVGDVNTNNLPKFYVPPEFYDPSDPLPAGIVVGDTSGNPELIVANGSLVECDHFYLGLSSNETGSVSVMGEESGLHVSGLTIGLDGSSNHLLVANGALIRNSNGFVGRGRSSSGNQVDVRGSNSLWSSSWLTIGENGDGNRLRISDGGRVASQRGQVGFASDSNVVEVSGEGSVWFNSFGELTVGVQGDQNQLLITDGGRVESSVGRIGNWGTMAIHAASNAVVVTGAGSVWYNRQKLYIGSDVDTPDWMPSGIGNLLTVSNGGWVQVGDVGTNNFPEHGSAGVISVGSLYGAELVVANGSKVDSDVGYIGLGNNKSGSVTVSGKGSVWDNSGQLHVGHNSSGNSLRIDDGGHVHAQWGSSIGYGEGADNNSVVVSGADSSLSIGRGLRALSPGILLPPISIWPQPTNQVPIIGYSPIDPSSGSVWNSDGNLTVGSSGSTNVLILTNSASGVGGEGLVISSGNQLVVSDGGFLGRSGGVSLAATNGTSAGGGEGLVISSGNQLVISDGGFLGGNGGLVLTNEAIVITNRLPVRLEPVMIMASMGGLSVGRGGSGNSLLIEDGAQVVSMAADIGETSSAWNNMVSVTGANSEWRNSGNLYLGGRMGQIYMGSNVFEKIWIDGGRGNSLYVSDGGLVSVGRDMHNRNYSTVTLDDRESRIEIEGNYYQDETSSLRFGIELDELGAPTNALMRVGGTAEFEAGTSVQYHYDGDIGWLDFDTFYTNLMVEADQLIVAGVTNANAVELQAINLDGSLVDVMLWEENQNIFGLVGRRHLADSAGFDAGSQMAGVSKEIDDLSLLGNPLAENHINLLNRMSSSQQNAQLAQRYGQGVPTYRHRQGLLGGQKQVLAQGQTFHSRAKPEGAAGPHEAEQGLRGWVRGYGSWAEHDGTSSFSGFDQNVYGTVVGLDKAFGNVLLGAAGGYSRSDLTQDNNDSSDAKTGFGVLYSSFGSTDWFGDLNVSYGRSAIETRSGTALGGEGDFDADHYGIYLGGGKEIRLSDGRLLFTPETALNMGYYDQEGYSDGLMDVDAYGRWSVQSRLGASLAIERQAKSVVLKPELRAFWLHEFNADPDQIGYTLGGGRYTFGMQSPDEDILEAGVGLTTTFSDRLELVLDIDAQHSARYDAITVGARVAFEF